MFINVKKLEKLPKIVATNSNNKARVDVERIFAIIEFFRSNFKRNQQFGRMRSKIFN